MAKGIKGKDIDKIKRIDDQSIIVTFNNGRKLMFKATMTDYDYCELLAKEI